MGVCMGFGISVYNERGELQAELTSDNIVTIHYSFIYKRGNGDIQNIRFLSDRFKTYSGYNPNIEYHTGGNRWYELTPKDNVRSYTPNQKITISNMWYIPIPITEQNINPELLDPVWIPSYCAIYDNATNKFYCGCDNNVSKLNITVGGK